MTSGRTTRRCRNAASSSRARRRSSPTEATARSAIPRAPASAWARSPLTLADQDRHVDRIAGLRPGDPHALRGAQDAHGPGGSAVMELDLGGYLGDLLGALEVLLEGDPEIRVVDVADDVELAAAE